MGSTAGGERFVREHFPLLTGSKKGKVPFFPEIPTTLVDLYHRGESSTALASTLGSPKLLGEQGPLPDDLVLFFFDGLSAQLYQEDLAKHLEPFATGGHLATSSMLAQFPSTTSAQVTTLYTMKPVEQTGVWEWFYYEQNLDRIISPLILQEVRRGNFTDLTQEQAEAIFPSSRLMETLAPHVEEACVLQPVLISESRTSSILTTGARRRGYGNMLDLFVKLEDEFEIAGKKGGGKRLWLCYLCEGDTLSHQHGPWSRQARSFWDRLFSSLAIFFSKRLSLQGVKKGRSFGTWVFSDHGHLEIDHEKLLYLDEIYPPLKRYLRRDDEGAPLAPAGSLRDYFLYLSNEGREHIGKIQQGLQSRLEGDAWVATFEELTSYAIWPTDISLCARAQFPDLCVCPKASHSVWWYEGRGKAPLLRGSHGGLTTIERETPFLEFLS